MPNRSVSDLKQTWDNWLAHEGPRLAASLSLYSLLSLAPLVILSIAIAALAFGRTAAQNAIINEVQATKGAGLWGLVKSRLISFALVLSFWISAAGLAAVQRGVGRLRPLPQ